MNVAVGSNLNECERKCSKGSKAGKEGENNGRQCASWTSVSGLNSIVLFARELLGPLSYVCVCVFVREYKSNRGDPPARMAIISERPERSSNGQCHRSKRSCRSRSSEPFSNWKAVLVVAVVVLCFAMLYPSMFHPLLSSYLSSPHPSSQTPSRPPIHPAMSSPRSPRDVHPGMRMASTHSESTSSSKGLFAWVLPLYTFGVVAFLVYTLFKAKRRKSRNYQYQADVSDSCDEENEWSKDGLGSLGRKRLRNLQERLKQTELAMNKILEQLSSISPEAISDGDELNNSEPTQINRCLSCEDRTKNREQYLRDLEKALRQFKHLSSYHTGDEMNESDSEVEDGAKLSETNNENTADASSKEVIDDSRSDIRSNSEDESVVAARS